MKGKIHATARRRPRPFFVSKRQRSSSGVERRKAAVAIASRLKRE